jgi:hypothetical protein
MKGKCGKLTEKSVEQGRNSPIDITVEPDDDLNYEENNGEKNRRVAHPKYGKI